MESDGHRDGIHRNAIAGQLRELIDDGRDQLPLPAGGRTLDRWRALARVAARDLALVKLFEGHTDALATLAEAGVAPQARASYGLWAAEPPQARAVFRRLPTGGVVLHGSKAWCSGAERLDRALLTVWGEDGTGPWLADVDLHHPGVHIDDATWHAVGMAATASATVSFEAAPARLVGAAGFYLSRPGFWHGGIGIAACWHGAACAVADALRAQANGAAEPGWHRTLALGEVDHLLSANAALLREAAAWIDRHPAANARTWALRTRAASDDGAQRVLRAATRAMGAGPLCLDPHFGRLAADLPVFLRQCHGDRDLAALGTDNLKEDTTPWTL